jgi:hypothetical protein
MRGPTKLQAGPQRPHLLTGTGKKVITSEHCGNFWFYTCWGNGRYNRRNGQADRLCRACLGRPIVWLQCDHSSCGKWRIVPDLPGTEHEGTERWYCQQNPDLTCNTCEAPQQPDDAMLDEAVLVRLAEADSDRYVDEPGGLPPKPSLPSTAAVTGDAANAPPAITFGHVHGGRCEFAGCTSRAVPPHHGLPASQLVGLVPGALNRCGTHGGGARCGALGCDARAATPRASLPVGYLGIPGRPGRCPNHGGGGRCEAEGC